MNIPSVGAPAAYDQTQPAPTSAIPPEKPVLDVRLDAPLELPSAEAMSAQTANFAEHIGRAFREAGVNIPPAPILTTDFEGHVRVSNAHPDKARIEQIFADAPELQQSFAKISSWSSLQRAAEHFKVFADEYQRLQGQPDVLRALVETEVARNKAPFYMAVTPAGVESFFGTSAVAG